MSWYSVPRVTAPTYHSYGLQRRPWAVVRDADGFSAEAINGYLQYAAWQDAPRGAFAMMRGDSPPRRHGWRRSVVPGRRPTSISGPRTAKP